MIVGISSFQSKRNFIGILVGISLLSFNLESSATSNSATLKWAGNTESDLAGYRVYHGLAPGVYAEVQNVGMNTTYKFKNLETNKVHYFTVTAYDLSGNESLPSSEVSKPITGTDTLVSDSIPPNETMVNSPEGLNCIGQTCAETFSPLIAALLPSSRSVHLGATASVFGILVNSGSLTATGCNITPGVSIPGTFTYQITDPETNAPIGSRNTPFDIPPGSFQTFVLSFIPSAPLPPTDVFMNFACINTPSARSTVGLNTVFLSVSATPIPDIIALVGVPTKDGITHLPGTTGGLGSTSVFVVASLNVGTTGTMTVGSDTGKVSLPLNITLCQTETTTGVCLAPPSPSVTTDILTNTTPSFGVFVEGLGPVPFDPAKNRVFIRFKDQNGITRGSTSVAIKSR